MNSSISRLLTAALLALAPVSAQDRPPVVRIDSGAIRGELLDVGGAPVQAFRGIPFAAPPVGDLRWRPPQPVDPWDGVRECSAFAPACPQPADLTYGVRFGEPSEDCLYLNVWASAQEPDEPRPVMVWIHGGGNLIGGAGTPIYDGRHFAADGVVLVSIQYRLGIFGYLAHPALTAESAEHDGPATSGNQGLLDQLAALAWVQRNAAAFGGDPERVTIFGESAGAANVTHLMASPLAEGLFHRAIAQSGYFGENVSDFEDAHRTGAEIAERLGVPDHTPESLARLRDLSVDDLLELPVTLARGLGAGRDRAFRLGPIVDGHVLPRSPEQVWSTGEMHPVPFLAGSLLDDGSIFSRANPIRRARGYRGVLRLVFGRDADRALELFPVDTDADVQGAVHRLVTILAFRAPARRLCRWIDAAGGEAWLYHFTRNPGRGRATREGVFHALEIGYVFGTLTAFGDDVDRALATAMRRRWIAFAGDGDPNADDLLPWPEHTPTTDHHLEFGDEVRVGTGLDRAACDLMDRLADDRR